MVQPTDIDLDRPDDDIVADLVASGQFDEDEARSMVAMWKRPEGSELVE